MIPSPNRIHKKIHLAASLKPNFIEAKIKVYPFSIILGVTNIAEQGVLSDNIRVQDYAQFKRVFTGLDTLICLWDSAYKYVTDEPYPYNLKKLYSVGDYFLAEIPQKNSSAVFDANAIDSSFLNQYEDEEVTLYTQHEVEEEDIFKFYIVPSVKSEKWLFITDSTNYYEKNSGTYSYSEIRLTSIANKIATSGQAIEQFIHRTPSGGGGYAWPLEQADGSVILDPNKKKDIPITSLQIEISGLAAIGSLYAYGREVNRDENSQTHFNPKVKVPELLLPYRTLTPTPSYVNTKPTFESEFYLLEDAYPQLETTYDDWKKMYSNADYLSAQVQNNYDGTLEVQKSYADIQKTNPIINGSFKHLIYDNDWKIQATKNWNTETNNVTKKTLNVKGKLYSIAHTLVNNIFIHSQYISLPLTKKHNVMWDLKSIPLIGGFLSFLTVGIDISWKDQRIPVKNGGINVLVPCGVVDYMNKRFSNVNLVTIDLNVFKNQSNVTNEALYTGINSMATIIKVELTNRFQDTSLPSQNNVFYTRNLGQSRDETGALIFPDGRPVLWNEHCVLLPRKADGFVIDTIVDQTLADAQVRYSLYANDFPIWNGTYKTKANYTGNIRDWLSIRKISEIKEFSTTAIMEYPAIIVSPKPSGVKIAVIFLQALNKSWSVNWWNNLTTTTTLSKDGASSARLYNRVLLGYNRSQRAGIPGDFNNQVFKPESENNPYLERKNIYTWPISTFDLVDDLFFDAYDLLEFNVQQIKLSHIQKNKSQFIDVITQDSPIVWKIYKSHNDNVQDYIFDWNSLISITLQIKYETGELQFWIQKKISNVPNFGIWGSIPIPRIIPFTWTSWYKYDNKFTLKSNTTKPVSINVDSMRFTPKKI